MRNLKYSIGGLLIIILGMGMAYAGDGQIDIATLPYTISSSGSYIVVKDLDLTTTDTNGITIDADNVTLDLNGHTLKGPGKTAGTTGSGIYLNNNKSNVAVRNGTVRDWRGYGVGHSDRGYCLIEAMRCYNNGGWGIYTGKGCIITGNECYDNAEFGIFSQSGNVITNNSCHENTGVGIFVASGCKVSENTCWGNESHGIQASYNSIFSENNCSENSGCGIYVASAFFGNQFINNTCTSNGDDGIHAESNGTEIRGNNCSYNYGDGIEISNGCRVVDNTCFVNGYLSGGLGRAGIKVTSSGNTIEHNYLVFNHDRGIYCNPATGNYIVGNRAKNSDITDYDIVAGNVWGAIVNMTAGGQIATTDPYANFQF